MKIAVVRFPGSNCDQDALKALTEDLGVSAEYVWHETASLGGYDGVFVPGGFSYGDYLRCGAMAAAATVMNEVRRFAAEGRPVLGACNGFQILCESGILPGALLQNVGRRFICDDVYLTPGTRRSPWTEQVDRTVTIPIAHGEGRYVIDEDGLKQLLDNDQVAFRYTNAQGQPTPDANPNGSVDNISGVLNEKGNVLGLMPHPERCTKSILGGTDGMKVLSGYLALVGA